MNSSQDLVKRRLKNVMFHGRILSVLTVTSLLTGCNLALPPANTVNKGAEVAQVLPQADAGAPVTLNIPLRFQNWPRITVFRNGDTVVVSSKSTHQNQWRGRMVTIYYVPSQNVVSRNGQEVLQSSVGLQEVHSVPISPDGSWHHVWRLKHSSVPQREIYLLVRTNEGQLGLAACKCKP